jgi:adenylate cyclase
MASAVERKLTTVMCADVAGYSRLMEKDEVATLNCLKKAREVFKSNLESHGGRLINMTGDGIIAEFPSVVNAMHCAVSIQNTLAEQTAQNMFEVPMVFRIGLNLGDVMIEEDDIFGDGVNIAARLEALAPPGGVCISGTVYDHVKGKFPLGFNYLGEKQVKNIETAVPVYALRLQADQANTDASAPVTPPPFEENTEEERLRKRVKRQASFYRRCLMMGSIVVFLLILNLITSPTTLWFFWPALPIAFTLALDGFRVFGKNHFAEDWEAREVERIKRRHRKRHGNST